MRNKTGKFDIIILVLEAAIILTTVLFVTDSKEAKNSDTNLTVDIPRVWKAQAETLNPCEITSSTPPVALNTPAADNKPTAEPTCSQSRIIQRKTLGVEYPSRGINVKAIVELPEHLENVNYPLIVMLHGYGGTCNEGGGFEKIAECFAENGIASIRMDFAGCGKSEENFVKNSMTTIKEDTVRAIDYMCNQFEVDENKIYLWGYSMGGRAVLELLVENQIIPRGIILTAPAADTNDLKNLFGGEAQWERLKAEAKQNGFAMHGNKALGIAFFDDLEKHMSLTDELSSVLAVDSIVFYSKNDLAVSPWVSEKTARMLQCESVVFDYGGHAYGMFGRDTEILDLLIRKATEFVETNM